MKGLLSQGVLCILFAGLCVVCAYVMAHNTGYDLTQLFEPGPFKSAVLHYPGKSKALLLAGFFGGGVLGIVFFLWASASLARIKGASAS